MKFIFVCGGVLSGLGKGITSASIGLLLRNAGFSVTSVKIDPYVSIDAGTMRPQEHGEVFVTADGGEIDQDLGNYERFLDTDFSKDHNITTGKVYQQVIDNERHFVYGGRDAEVIPDVIDEIKRRIYKVGKGNDFVMVEIGGTVGDIENMPFLIAAREIGREHKSAYLMVTYLPFLHTVGELKTKPTQHAVMLLRQTGINPDFIVTRAVEAADEPRLDNISKRCFLDRDRIFDVPDQDCIYRIPLMLKEQGMVDGILKFFRIRPKDKSGRMMKEWGKFVDFETGKGTKEVAIALVGKYVQHGNHAHNDTYLSVLEALRHAEFRAGVKLKIEMMGAETLNRRNYKKVLSKYSGIVVPQGWGSRGHEGKLLAIQYARENKIPYLGLCYGMQMAVIEFGRNVLGLSGANSTEVDEKTRYPVIHIMPEQVEYLKKKQYGGTIRLGAWPCHVKRGTALHKLYGKTKVSDERHRHRYEFNNEYRDKYEAAGMVLAGLSPDSKLVEAIEIPNHPFFVGTQFHPEYISRPLRPHPVFVGFARAVKKRAGKPRPDIRS